MAAALSPALAYFVGRHSVLQSELPRISFRLTTRVPTRGVYSQSVAAGWELRIRPTELPNEYACELRAAARPALGVHRIEVGLRLVGLDSMPLPDVNLVIDGEIVPDIQVYPRRLMFGGRAAGTTAEENILVESLSGRPIRLTRVDSTTPALTGSADLSRRASRHVVRVRRWVDPGDQKGTLTIHFDTNGGPPGSVQVVAQATGFDP